MILYFRPPPDLSDLVWNAAVAAAEVLGSDALPLEILGPFRHPRAGAGRRIVAALLRSHVWLKTRPWSPHGLKLQKAEIAITFGPAPPYTQKSACRLTTPMIGYLLGKRDHSTIVIALRQMEQPGELVQQYVAANAKLADQYTSEPIYMEAVIHTLLPSKQAERE